MNFPDQRPSSRTNRACESSSDDLRNLVAVDTAAPQQSFRSGFWRLAGWTAHLSSAVQKRQCAGLETIDFNSVRYRYCQIDGRDNQIGNWGTQAEHRTDLLPIFPNNDRGQGFTHLAQRIKHAGEFWGFSTVPPRIHDTDKNMSLGKLNEVCRQFFIAFILSGHHLNLQAYNRSVRARNVGPSNQRPSWRKKHGSKMSQG